MSEAAPSPPLANRLANYARETSATVLSGLALVTPLMVVDALVNPLHTEAENLSASHEIATATKNRLAEEYGKVLITGVSSSTPNSQTQTFLINIACKDGSKEAHRIIKAKAETNTPLGDCNLGKSVTESEQQPKSGNVSIEPKVKKILRATRNNNHTVFTDTYESTPQPIAAQPVTPSTSSVTTTVAPSPGTTTSTGGTGTPPPPPNPYAAGNKGVDVGWPQCTGSNSTSTSIGGELPIGISFGIVELEDGLGYSVNPCLSAEVTALKAAGVTIAYYDNTGFYPQSSHISYTTPNTCSTGDMVCVAGNYGYDNATYSVSAAESAGISIAGAMVNADVEVSNSWVTESNGVANEQDAQENEASLQGTEAGLIASGASVSETYLNPNAADTLFNDDLFESSKPIWLASGDNTEAAAEANCDTIGPDNGQVNLVQYNGSLLDGQAVDMDVSCGITVATAAIK